MIVIKEISVSHLLTLTATSALHDDNVQFRIMLKGLVVLNQHSICSLYKKKGPFSSSLGNSPQGPASGRGHAVSWALMSGLGLVSADVQCSDCRDADSDLMLASDWSSQVM